MEEKSTVFLTPPFSDETKHLFKGNSRLYQLNKADTLPKFQLESEEKFPEGKQRIDYIKELYRLSLTSIVSSKIFKQLTDLELLRASHVSSTWRTVIRYEDLRSGRRTSRYIRKMKSHYTNQKENLKINDIKDSKPDQYIISTQLLSPRTPLIDRNTNINSISNLVKQEHESPFSTPSPLDDKDVSYRQCPECQSPSRTTKHQTGHCMKCDHDFCLHCFYTNNQHSPTCLTVGGHGITSSPNKLMKKNRRYSLGSRDNKARLKRI